MEVVSPGSNEGRDRDDVAKSEEYLAPGILEYRIVDPKPRQVTVSSRREEGGRWSERVFGGNDVIVSPLLPGLPATAESVFAGLDGEEDN